jgi:peroxiredoxin
MGLQEKLNQLKAGFEAKAPKEALEVMHGATWDLRDSGIMAGVVKVGDTAPDFELKNADEKIVRLQDLLSDGPLVLSFYRGKWWPYCNIELDALQQVAGEIQSLGANLLAISPQLPEFSRELIKGKSLAFDLLGDPGNQVAQKYGLVFALPEDLKALYLQFGIDVAKHNGDDSWTLPMPGRFIIDQTGKVRYAEVDPDYTVRPEPEHTIAALKKLSL